jgi:hypothetical protein
MAGSTSSLIGTDAWAASPITPGPMGTNNDAGDLNTPKWFMGDTPGPLGVNDHADPNTNICRVKTSLERYLPQIRASRVNDPQLEVICRIVKNEFAEVTKIMRAYADEALLREAKERDWSGSEYSTKVAEEVFGKSEQGGTYVNRMYTNSTTCRIGENWDRAKYREKGFPDIIYEADRAHEEVHRKSCLSRGVGNALQYNADMSDPKKLSKDELKAYSAKLILLDRWLHKNCF